MRGQDPCMRTALAAVGPGDQQVPRYITPAVVGRSFTCGRCERHGVPRGSAELVVFALLRGMLVGPSAAADWLNFQLVRQTRT